MTPKLTSFSMYPERMLRTLFTAVLAPQQCVLCGKHSGSLPICRECITEEFMPYLAGYDEHNGKIEYRRCGLCGKILISEQDYCTHCTRLLQEKPEPYFCRKTFTLFPYLGLGQEILPLWKNHAMRNFAAVFAPLVHHFLHKQPELCGIPLVPVPPRPQKMKEKGWDQIEDIIHYLAVFPETTICRCLKRCNGIAQKTLSREQRLHNLHGKIQLCTKKPLPESVIILDDVRTTGSTLETCAQVLTEHGCQCVYALCLFFD